MLCQWHGKLRIALPSYANDPHPLTVPEGRERRRRQGDGTVGIKAMELPPRLAFRGKHARCQEAELPPQSAAAREKHERARPRAFDK